MQPRLYDSRQRRAGVPGKRNMDRPSSHVLWYVTVKTYFKSKSKVTFVRPRYHPLPVSAPVPGEPGNPPGWAVLGPS